MDELPDGVTETLPGETWGNLTDAQRASVVKLAARPGFTPATLWAGDGSWGSYAGYQAPTIFIGIELDGYAHS